MEPLPVGTCPFFRLDRFTRLEDLVHFLGWNDVHSFFGELLHQEFLDLPGSIGQTLLAVQDKRQHPHPDRLFLGPSGRNDGYQ